MLLVAEGSVRGRMLLALCGEWDPQTDMLPSGLVL